MRRGCQFGKRRRMGCRIAEAGRADMRWIGDLAEQSIENEAQMLLDDFSAARGVPDCSATAVEQIAEKHLKIGFEFDDLRRRFGTTCGHPECQILSAMYFHTKRFVFDESLDPGDDPKKEIAFSREVAHELGHYSLHGPGFDSSSDAIIGATKAGRSLSCRSTRDRMESQADYFASCLLMPRISFVAAWNRERASNQRNGTRKPIMEALADDFAVAPTDIQARLTKLGLVRLSAVQSGQT
jgi:hypothetical protein